MFNDGALLLLPRRKQGHQSEKPVGDERGRDHGGAAAWMIFVQRGKAERSGAARARDLTRDDSRHCLRSSHWQEASELSSLKPQLEELGVPLVAVVKENIGTEIEDFRPHFAGDIYIDEEVKPHRGVGRL